VGCEITLAEFSFVDGVMKTYHQFINPGEIPIGYAFEATKYAANTHRIPLPPDSFGSVSDHVEIFDNIISFVRGQDEDETPLLPLYARPETSRLLRAF
jgi:protein maelstrom